MSEFYAKLLYINARNKWKEKDLFPFQPNHCGNGEHFRPKPLDQTQRLFCYFMQSLIPDEPSINIPFILMERYFP